MTEQEYKDGLKRLKAEYLKAQRELSVEYALSNNIYQIGDIVKDLDGFTIQITEINVKYSSIRNQYLCVYTGVVLNKDLTPKTPQCVIETACIKQIIKTVNNNGND